MNCYRNQLMKQHFLDIFIHCKVINVRLFLHRSFKLENGNHFALLTRSQVLNIAKPVLRNALPINIC